MKPHALGTSWWRTIVLVCLFFTFYSSAHARFAEPLCPASHQEFQAGLFQTGLCYANCKPSYSGEAATCTERCAEGSTDTGAVCSDVESKAKNSYGRGAGSALICRPGTEQNGALCYPKCSSGYNGVGPVCWENTPSGWNDRGLSFDRWVWTGKVWRLETRHKGSYGRGTGEVVSSCPAGTEKNGALCYPSCASNYSGSGPVCWERCPSGYTDDGAFCRRDISYAKSSYGRGAGVARTSETGASFTKTVPTLPKEDFYFVALSDTQLAWDDTSKESIAAGGTGGLSKKVLWKNARMYNLRIAQAINGLPLMPGNQPQKLRLTQQKPAFTTINGDLTAYFHEKEHAAFREYYDAGYPGAHGDALKTPVYLGLGNHDYENNVGDCSYHWTSFLDTNRCAKNAMNMIRGSVFLGYVKNFPKDQVESFDAESLAYSWNKGNWHFVQLHNGRTDHNRQTFYTKSQISISSPESWLREDLKRATARGQKIIVFSHEPLDGVVTDVFNDSNVVAAFAGHYHANQGEYATIKAKKNGNDFSIPIYLSGSADYGTFIVGEIINDELKVIPMKINQQP